MVKKTTPGAGPSREELVKAERARLAQARKDAAARKATEKAARERQAATAKAEKKAQAAAERQRRQDAAAAQVRWEEHAVGAEVGRRLKGKEITWDAIDRLTDEIRREWYGS